ncbi:MAG: ion channel protein Tsx [Anaeromyxobacter sp.]
MTLRTSKAILALALALAAPAAFAGGFSTTNVQLLQGYNWDDELHPGYTSGTATTLTLNHFSTWEHGDQFFFADLTRYESAPNFAGHKDAADIYAEWHPRLWLSDFFGSKDSKGLVRHWGLAGEVNQGANFYAYLAGVGFDFNAPPGWVLGTNVFYRYDKYAYNQWQVSPFWTVPFKVGAVDFVFTGFIDVNGTKDGNGDNTWELWAQPELLVDVLGLAGGPKGKLHAGVEWAVHTAPVGDDHETSSVPQAMVQWTIY